jgi:hypothetical protein
MAYQTKFEVVRTQNIESGHTSLSSNNGLGHKVDVEPQALPWWQAGRLVGALIDSCAFFVYAVAVKMHESLPMESPRVRLLLKLSNLVSISAIMRYPPRNPRLWIMADEDSF